MSVKNDLLKEIQKQRKKSKSQKKFSGNFLDYVEFIKDNPGVVKTSHKRLYDVLSGHGFKNMPDSDPRKTKIFDNENIKVYDYFKSEFFGMEKVNFRGEKVHF